jgi:hypothetical protein
MNDVNVPEGMVFVGYYCQHEYIDGTGLAMTPHRSPFSKTRPKYKAERGWDESHSTTKALTFPDHTEQSAERHCQYRVPMFVRQADLDLRLTQ